MKLTIRTGGLFNPAEFRSWEREQKEAYRRDVALGLADAAKPIVRRIQQRAGSVFKLQGARLPRSIRYKVFASRPDRFPAVLIESRIPWMGIHEEGGTISGPLLIPLNLRRRIGRKAFKRIVDRLLAGGNAFFKKVGGRTILFAEAQPEFSAPLARWKQALRKGLGGGRIKRGAEIPIAVLVPSVSLRARLGLVRTVQANAGLFVQAIENRLRR